MESYQRDKTKDNATKRLSSFQNESCRLFAVINIFVSAIAQNLADLNVL